MKISLKNRTHRGIYLSDIFGDVILFLLLIQLLPPQGIHAISPTIQNIVWPTLAKYIVVIVMAAVFLVVIFERRSVDMRLVFMLILPISAGIITFAHGVSLYGWFRNYLIIIVAVVVMQLYKNQLVRLVRVFRFYLAILVALNFVYIIIFPDGAYSSLVYKKYNWLLGYKSSLQCYIVPYLCFERLESSYSNKKLRFYIMSLLCLIESMLSRNAMLTVGVLLLVIFWIFDITKRLSVFNNSIYIAAYGVINSLFILFSNLLTGSGFFRGLLIFLGKNNDLGGRMSVIWPRAIRMISEQWGFGYGVYKSEFYTNYFGGMGRVHAHNQLLQILLDGGVVLLIIYFIWMLYSCSVLNKNMDCRSSHIILSCSFVVYIMSAVEVFIYGTAYFGTWIMLFMCVYTEEIDNQFRMHYNIRNGTMEKAHDR